MEHERPNILVIWGDDIGWQNLSCYGHGVMGYTTPNIDRLANEGAMFLEHYGEPSCTSGRAAFITGQLPIRSGMTRIGFPGDQLGILPETPCLAQNLKEVGYACGHFGKNHLGDRNEYLPTVHGFDEFYGNLYHLNAEDNYEQLDYKQFAADYSGSFEKFEEQFGARGVLHSFATDEDDDTTDPRWGRVGKQRIEDTGPLSKERQQHFDDGEVIPKALDFMQRAADDDKPFFVWLNTIRMHLYTELGDDWRYAASEATTDADVQGSGMLQHDHDIGMVLDWLDEQGLADNTIVWYATDNGPEHSSWPDGATTPFRGEKMTTYEGGVRLPSLLRWPGTIDPGQKMLGLQTHYDMFTSLAKAGGLEDVAADEMDRNSQYIDGVDQTDWWKGDQDKSSRNHVFHYLELNINALRLGPWKWHLATNENYYSPSVPTGKPLLFNVHADPFESYDSIDSYGHLVQEKNWLLYPTRDLVQKHLQTLIDYPPVQGGSSFDATHLVEDVLKAHE